MSSYGASNELIYRRYCFTLMQVSDDDVEGGAAGGTGDAAEGAASPEGKDAGSGERAAEEARETEEAEAAQRKRRMRERQAAVMAAMREQQAAAAAMLEEEAAAAMLEEEEGESPGEREILPLRFPLLVLNSETTCSRFNETIEQREFEFSPTLRINNKIEPPATWGGWQGPLVQ
jgi:hypothetical protein